MRKFHVSYQFINDEDRNGYGSITMTITGKLTEEVVEGFRQYIDNETPGIHSIILAITELE